MSPSSVSSEEPETRFERVGRYDLIVELSRGALGSFWAARVATGAEEGRIVCVRRIRVGSDRHDVSSRLTEAALAAMEVRHPNILAVLDVALIGQELCVVSEFVEGESLHTLQRLAFARRAPLAPAMALRIAFDLLSALGAARSMWQERSSSPGDSFAQRLHGGLSPDSVLVAGYGDVMLVDLCVSGAAAEFEAFVQHPDLLPYRAPELVAGKGPADERADVFSIGVLIWELLTNQGLFGSVSRAPRHLGPFADAPDATMRAEIDEIQAKLATHSVPRLDAPGRQGIRVSAQIADLVARALERDPARRFQTLSEMQSALAGLPRDAVVSPEQLSLAIERLARSSSEERRRVMDCYVRSMRPESGPPESGRPTRRPAPAATPAHNVPIPALKPPSSTAFSHVADESRLLGFSEQEVPTRPGEELGRVSRDARKMTIKGMPAVKPAAGAAPVIATKAEPPAATDAGASEPPSESYSALKPARVVAIGSKPPVRARSETPPPPLDAFTPPQPVEPDALRAAFEAARQTELAQPEATAAFPSPSVTPPPVARLLTPAAARLLTPAASLRPASAPEQEADPRRQRARMMALVIGGIIVLIALVALARALFGS
ncbi:MAG TPA: protein kinase [Polyangiaceae bacterium]